MMAIEVNTPKTELVTYTETDFEKGMITVCSNRAKVTLSAEDALKVGIDLIHRSCLIHDKNALTYELASI